MQVTKIQSNNTTFGFNPEVNKQLLLTLENAKKNKNYYQYLHDLCIVTNNAEIDLRDAEIKGKKNLRNLLAESFLPIKITLTNMIDNLFPEFNYREKEIESYLAEVNELKIREECPEHWLNGLVSTLEQHESREKREDYFAKVSETIEKKFPGLKLRFTDNPEQTIKELQESEEADETKEVKDVLDSVDGKSKVVQYIPKGEALKGFNGLGGMENLKQILNKLVVNYLKHPKEVGSILKSYGLKLPDAILLYGPPGCGKTTIVEHLSVEAGTQLLKLRPGKYGSVYANGTEKNLEAAFDYAASIATEEKPVILFIDDVDTVIGSRGANTSTHKVEELGTFLERIQNAHNDNVLVVAATNKYDKIDDAVKRRFTEQIFVGLPDLESRESIIRHYLSGDECEEAESLLKDNEAIKRLAEKMNEFPNSLIRTTMLKAKSIPSQEAVDNFMSNGVINKREVTEKDIEDIIALPEIQNQKIKEENYQSKANRKSIGFSSPKTIG